MEGRLARFEIEGGALHRNDVAYPSLTALVRVRPWTQEVGPERGFEMRASFAHAVGLRSRSAATDEVVDTRFWRLALDVAMMFDVDDTVQLGLGVGFGFDSFSLGAQSVVVIPSADYPYLRPHLRARFQLERELAVLELDVAYRAVLDRGALSTHFGANGETQGFDIQARLGGAFDMGFSYGLEAGLAGYFHFFDGEALTAPARSGMDLGLWLGLQVGYAFR